MGHLTRQMAVAMAASDAVDPVFFSLSRAVAVIERHGLRGEYCPSRERGWFSAVKWQDYLRERLLAFVAETRVKAFVFDGVVPYNGLLRARCELPDLAFVWVRRGFWRPGVRTAPLKSASLFDLVLEPGDFASAGDHGATSTAGDAVRLPPVSLLAHVDQVPRAQAARALGLDPDRPAALLTLSSGVLNDVAAPGTAALQELLADPAWQVAVTSSRMSAGSIPLVNSDRCVELRGVYPLAKYLSAFDAAVAAGGYNSVHELLSTRIPTLFVPNRSSGTDDQPARTRWLADAGYALYADEANVDDVRKQTRRLHDASVRAELAAACSALPRPDGSTAAARELADLIARGAEPVTAKRRLQQADVRVRAAAKRTLGPKATATVRKVLRRDPDSGPTEPMSLRLVTGDDGGDGTLMLTERLDDALLRSDQPVEHLIAGASAAYRAERIRIADSYYNLRR